MSVNRDVLQSAINPAIGLIHANADQVRHNVCQPVVVIPFDPHDLNAALGIGQLPDASQKLPVIFREAGKFRSAKMSPSRISRSKRFSFSRLVASRAWLVSAPRCRSERISVL